MTSTLKPEQADLRTRTIRLYNGASKRSRNFRYALLTFDVTSILFFIFSSLIEHTPWVQTIEYIIAAVIAVDFAARYWIAPNRLQFMTRFTSWADIVVFITLIAPIFVESFIFLRVLRAVRLIRSYRVLHDLRDEFLFFKRNEEVIHSVLNLTVFVFVITAIVYVLQVRTNPLIDNYIDALYFTITTLTTTGFGDVTLHGSSGRLLAVVIMVVGVGLFLRLIQTIFRPPKVNYDCPDCGLKRHDPDAIHCKHCGKILRIETEGL